MTEAAGKKVQLGQQSALGTAVAATTVFPVEAGFEGFTLDRAMQSPNEDFGTSSREYAGRGSNGARMATASMPFVGKFENFMHIQNAHFDQVTTAGGPTYTHTTIFDDSGAALSAALKAYTVQYGVPGSTQDEWRAVGAIIKSLRFGFEALTASGNSMWNGTAEWLAVNREPSTMTSSQSPPATLTTMEGHRTTIADGSTSTAFGSLSSLAGLRQFEFQSELNAVLRIYGGSSDIATVIGQSDKGTVAFNAMIAIASGAKTSLIDVYEVASETATDRRFRVSIGSAVSPNAATLDFRARFTATNVGTDGGERLYAVEGVFVYDSTLASRAQWVTTNAVSTVP